MCVHAQVWHLLEQFRVFLDISSSKMDKFTHDKDNSLIADLSTIRVKVINDVSTGIGCHGLDLFCRHLKIHLRV